MSIAGAVVVLALTAGWLLVTFPDTASSAAGALTRHLPAKVRDGVTGVTHTLSARLTSLVHHPSRLGHVAVYAAGNWLLDALVLGILLVALGQPLRKGPLLT